MHSYLICALTGLHKKYRGSGKFCVQKFSHYNFSHVLIFVVSLGAQIVRIDFKKARQIYVCLIFVAMAIDENILTLKISQSTVEIR